MLLRKKFDNRVLLILALSTIAFRGLLETVIGRQGHSTDLTDFMSGVLLGIGIGLLALFVWRLMREGRGNSTGASTN